MSEEWAALEFYQRQAVAAEQIAETMKIMSESLVNLGQQAMKVNESLSRLAEHFEPMERGFADE